MNIYGIEMKTQFELSRIKEYRNLDNYKVLNFGSHVKNKKCLVCFSSNGLYYPNTNNNLDSIIEGDKYEWENVIRGGFERVIFVRDIYKQWYVQGISEKYDSVEKVKELLGKLTKGYENTFIGSSAGGYAAVLFGGLLDCSKIISFSGQFDIALAAKCHMSNELVHKVKDKKYFNIKDTQANVFYFYPSLSSIDKIQYDLIKNNPSVKVITVVSDVHGVPLFSFSLNKLVHLSNHKLIELTERKYSKKYISFSNFYFYDLFLYIVYKLKKKLF